MEKYTDSHEPKSRNRDFRTELINMAGIDQTARKNWEKTGKSWDNMMDRRHTTRLKEIVKKIGWPTKSKVGKEGSIAAWILVQHADHDAKFQKNCLDLMKQEPEKEVRKQDIAFLEDRVRVNTHRPTLYGTQFYHDSEGKFKPCPIEDVEHLNARREAMGLGPFEEYEQEMQQIDKKTRDN